MSPITTKPPFARYMFASSLLFFFTHPVPAQITYDITDLGVPSGSISSHAQAINDSGLVATFSDTNGDSPYSNQRFAFTWQNNQAHLLDSPLTPAGLIGERNSDGVGIKGFVANMDNAGQVVGNFSGSDGQQHAFFWQNSQLTDIGTLGGFEATASASNASGQVWGNYTDNSEASHGFLWQNGAVKVDLGADSQVLAVNANGQAIIVQDGQYYLWQKDPVTGDETKQALAGVQNISPTAINNAGQIVGINFGGEGDDAARIWQNGTTTDLASPTGAYQTHAYAINNAGQIVGFSDMGNFGYRALLWDVNGNPIDLNTLSNAQSLELELGQAFSINNLGQIVGEAYYSETTHGFIATPTGNLNWSAGSGAWDNANHWDSGLGLTPNALLSAQIQAGESDLQVSGPVSDTVIKSLSLGSDSGIATATLDLNSGSLTALNQINIYGNGTLNLSAPQLTAQSIQNQGALNISGSGTHTIVGDFNNDGSIKVTDTSVQYTGNFVNNGAYISDPSTNQFTNLSVGSNGYITGGVGDQFIVSGDFNNASTQASQWNTADADLIFSGPVGTQHTMGLAGVDKGVTSAGSANNFAWGSMTLNSGNQLNLVDGNTTPGAALYASRLILPDGLSQLKVINSNYNVYYDPTLPDNQYLLGATRTFGSGSGQLLPWSSLVPIPDVIVYDRSLTPNQQGFAAALAEACSTPSGALISRCLQIKGLSQAEKKAAIASLTPDQVPGQMAGPIKFNMTRMDAPFSRLANLRNGGGHAPLSFNFNGMQIDNKALGGAAGDGTLFGESPLGVFLQTRFTFGNQENTLWDRGFNSDSRAVTLGTDYRFTEHLVTGLAFNYTNQSLGYENSAGHSETDTYMGAVYGSYYLPQDFYIDWVANYGSNEYAFNRQFQYTGFKGQTQSNPNGEQYSFTLNTGKSFNFQEWSVNPYVRAEYQNLHIAQYQEQGGNGFDMTTAAQNNDSFITSLGAQFSYTASMNWGILIPAIRVEWDHQYLNDNRAIQMRLTEAAAGLGNFVIQTGNPDRDYVNLGASLSATLPNGGSGFVQYETRLGQTAITDHIIEGGVRLAF